MSFLFLARSAASKPRSLALLAAGLAGIACSSSSSSPGASGTHASSTQTSGTGGTTTTSGTGGHGGSAGAGGAAGQGGGITLPPVKAACASPAIKPGDTWMAATGDNFPQVAISWSGTEAALVYQEAPSCGPSTPTLSLQRLSGEGVRIGSPIALASGGTTQVLTVASDASRHLACWDGAVSGATVACAAVPVGGGTVSMGLMVTGRHPSIAIGPHGYALAYEGDTDLVVQALDDEANAVGSPVTVTSLALSAPSLVATTSGFAVLGSDFALRRLGPTLAPVGGPVSVGTSFNGELAAIAAAGDLVGAVWGSAMSVTFAMVDATGKVVGPATVDDPSFMGTYGVVSAAGGDGSFALAWSSISGQIGYRAAGGTGALLGTPVQAVGVDWDENPVAIAAVADGFLIATAAGEGLNTMTMAHLACP
jgi:hypothetical protein